MMDDGSSTSSAVVEEVISKATTSATPSRGNDTNNSCSSVALRSAFAPFNIKDAYVAEISWVLFVVNANMSINSNKTAAEIMKLMFPDSKIAANLKLSKYKYN